ncbi:hypothetical protein DI09_69p130 [Mitosporidium daphniae]|uniref:Uncharacterized protein n=1 Tax=Mitosporidium daphniae TaxID=1485682 RepID=A0A098VNW8_9MICR|nr:uncharacterized protein DI09_69p130 [Mitosporidium daphniae]KGG50489.1 hypothetical protein DI09_69p130 [Mitosporidium daphniae]|eukprot:XP_013236916.1 uncharacterized protein DI09_69p130 [Mitosporidium daphniae]
MGPCEPTGTIGPNSTLSQHANFVANSLHRFAVLTEKYLDVLTSPTPPNHDGDTEFKVILEELVSLDQSISEKIDERKDNLISNG